MNRYLVLYHSEAALNGPSVKEMFAQATPEQMKAGMGAWQAWHEKCGSAVVDLGSPLDQSTTLTAASADRTKSTVTGYTILQAASIEDATELMKGHPHLRMPGGSAQILECVRMPGMG